MRNDVPKLNKVTLVVKAVVEEAKGIRSYELVSPNAEPLPAIEAGAHLALHLKNGFTRHYSLFNEPGESNSYQIAVLNDPSSRGGSAFIHREISEGDFVSISGPRNNFPVSSDTKTAMLIAGGIGVTPIISMARFFHKAGIPFQFHYCAKTAAEAAFVELLKNNEPYRESVIFHFDQGDPSQGINLKQVLDPHVDGLHLYCCGPNGLMNAVEDASSHWPQETVHFERFKAEASGKQENSAFKVVLSRSNVELVVPEDKTIMQVMRENGIASESLCEEGICGSCLTDVLSGKPEHRDQILTDEEKAACDVIAICCSRAKTDTLVLDI